MMKIGSWTIGGFEDKMVVLTAAVFFTLVSIWGFNHHDADMSSFASDLTKQLIAAFLALIAGSAAKQTPPPPAIGVK
jgi:hypothetical protein